MDTSDTVSIRDHLLEGQVIPAHPLALNSARKLDERRQRGLTRYYIDAGAGGIAVGVHTTQFAIRNPGVGLYRPVLELAADEASRRHSSAMRLASPCQITFTYPISTDTGSPRYTLSATSTSTP
jgi:hypothetical protein